MSTMEDIIKAIKESDRTEGEKEDMLDILQARMRVITGYFGGVAKIKVELQLADVAGDEYRKTAGKYEELQKSCSDSCKRLNRMCEDLQIDPFCDFDPDDKDKLEAFCGQMMMGLFMKGIRK